MSGAQSRQIPLGGIMGRGRRELNPELYAHRFAVAMKARRERLKLTHAEVAERAGVTEPAVWQWENGTRAPSLNMLPKIAEALETPLRKLMPPE